MPQYTDAQDIVTGKKQCTNKSS